MKSRTKQIFYEVCNMLLIIYKCTCGELKVGQYDKPQQHEPFLVSTLISSTKNQGLCGTMS